jgi:hypothetical protein
MLPTCRSTSSVRSRRRLILTDRQPFVQDHMCAHRQMSKLIMGSIVEVDDAA